MKKEYMNGQSEENLKELFEKFVTGEQAEKAVEDICIGEQILRDNPAPKPSDELIAGIKSEIAINLLHKKENAIRYMLYKVAVVAAVVFVLTAISIKFFEKGEESEKVMYASIIPTAIWESDDIAADDVELAVLTAEVEQVADEVLSLRMGEDGGNGQSAVTELEIEMIEIESDFWKG
jgi:hypothetical protein